MQIRQLSANLVSGTLGAKRLFCFLHSLKNVVLFMKRGLGCGKKNYFLDKLAPPSTDKQRLSASVFFAVVRTFFIQFVNETVLAGRKLDFYLSSAGPVKLNFSTAMVMFYKL